MVAACISTPPFPVCSDPRALGLFLPWETAHPKPNGASLPRTKPRPLNSLLALLRCPRAALGVSAGGSPALSLPPLTFLELRPLPPSGTSPWGVLPCQPGKRLDSLDLSVPHGTWLQPQVGRRRGFLSFHTSPSLSRRPGKPCLRWSETIPLRSLQRTALALFLQPLLVSLRGKASLGDC